MENKEKSIFNETNEEIEIEKDFHKTKTGSFMKIICIIGIVLMALNLIIGGFEAFVNIKNLDYDKYKTLFTLGEYFGNVAAIMILGYSLTLLEYLSEQKRKKKQK